MNPIIPVTAEELEIAYHQPISKGFKSSIRQILPLFRISILCSLPLALAIVFLGDVDTIDFNGDPISWVCAIVYLFSFPFIALYMSRAYLGIGKSGVAFSTLKRVIPWVLTWILVLTITFAGYIALIIPGIYLSMRLFWADEFALAKGLNPIQAIIESWRHSEGRVVEIFKFQILAGFANYLVVIPFFLLALFAGGLIGFFIMPLGFLIDVNILNKSSAMWMTLSLFPVGYGLIHGPQLAYFYGARAVFARESISADASHLPGDTSQDS